MINPEIKLEFLIYYYRQTLGSPKNTEELLKKLESQSAQSMKALLNKKKLYDNSNYKQHILNKILEGGKYKMNKKHIFKSNIESNVDYSFGDIYITNNNNEKVMLDSLTSKPEIHGNYIAYICPYDFETQNNIYLYDFEKDTKKEVYTWQELACPKFLKWKNSEVLYVILGQTYGTVGIGGDLYSLNVNSKELILLKQFPPNIQITSFEFKENQQIELKGIRYVDDNFNDYEEYKEIMVV